MEFTRTIKWLIWVMHVPSNLLTSHETTLSATALRWPNWNPVSSIQRWETKEAKKLIVQQEIHPNGTWNGLQQWLWGIENSPLIHISWNNGCSYDGWLKPRRQIKGNGIWFYIAQWIVWLFTIVSVIRGCICSGRYVVSTAHWHSNPGLFPSLLNRLKCTHPDARFEN